MGETKEHALVKLVIGFIYRDEVYVEKAKDILRRHFGKIDFESEALPFAHTDYYREELGEDLKKRFISFERLIPPARLPRVKLITNAVEKRLSIDSFVEGSRSVNIDPGYLDLAKLVLASTKNYSHRLYLGQGVYAEVTLFYKDNTFTPWEWTYPDFKSAEYVSICNRIREIYVNQIKA